jgi:hypothetical protein
MLDRTIYVYSLGHTKSKNIIYDLRWDATAVPPPRGASWAVSGAGSLVWGWLPGRSYPRDRATLGLAKRTVTLRGPTIPVGYGLGKPEVPELFTDHPSYRSGQCTPDHPTCIPNPSQQLSNPYPISLSLKLRWKESCRGLNDTKGLILVPLTISWGHQAKPPCI